MPLYEYECKECSERFALLRHMDDSDAEVECPKCGASPVERVFSLFGTSLPGFGCLPGDFGGG